MASDQATCRLESLWPELRAQIIWALTDFPALRALVHASPVFHADYREQRRRLLDSYELGYLDPRLRAEAVAVVRSPRIYDGPWYVSQRDDIVAQQTIDFLKEFARAHDDRANEQNEWVSCRSVDEKTDLRRLHQVMKVVVDDYCTWMASKMPPEAPPLKLSDLERIRLLRAMYRYQNYCDLLAHNPKLRPCSGWGHPNMYFFPPFPPWQVMEIACVQHYLGRRWLALVQEVSDTGKLAKYVSTVYHDVEAKSSAFKLEDDSWDAFDRLDIGSDGGDEDDENYQIFHISEMCDRFACHGPRFLAKFLAIASPEGRREFVDKPDFRGSGLSHNPLSIELHQYPYIKRHPFRRKDDDEDVLKRAAKTPDAELASDEVKWLYETHGIISSGSKYERLAFLDGLPKMPESEQPSDGWKWFCKMHDVKQFAVGPTMYLEFRGVLRRCKRDVGWGFPFWDKENVGLLAPNSPAPDDDSE